MAKYRKKPVEIEAVRWTGENVDEIKEFVGVQAKFTYYTCPDDSHYDYASWNEPPRDRDYLTSLDIYTLEGRMQAKEGDYIIRGVNGEFYPCKPDIFEKTYDKVEQ